VQTILIGIDPANGREHQLDLAVVQAAASLEAHEFSGLELALVSIDVRHQLRDDLAGRVLH
jgi:hypothetical protein